MKTFLALLLSLFIVSTIVSTADATTRYADQNLGSDCSGSTYSIASRNCTGSDGPGYKLAATALSAIVAGDTVYFRAGTWTVRWDLSGHGGTSTSNYTTIAGYPGETVTYAPSYVYDTISNFIGMNSGTRANFLIIQDLVIDGINGPATPNDFSVKGLYMTNIHDVIIQRNEIKRWNYNGIGASGVSNIQILNNKIHDQVSTCITGTRWYAVYAHDGNNFLIQGNDIYNNPGGGLQIYPNPTNVTIRYNKIHSNNTFCTNGAAVVGGVIIEQDSNGPVTGIMDHNVVYNNGVAGGGNANGIEVNVGVTGFKIYNNTTYNNKNLGIYVNGAAGASNIIRNNIGYQNNQNQGGGDIGSAVGSTILDHNLTTNPSFTNAGAGDFSLLNGSAAIDAGVNVSLAFNGSAPEIGAFEMPVFASCVVENATPSKLSIIFTNNLYPPMRPTSGITGITARKAGSNDVVTAAVVAGTNQIDLTLTNAIANGNAVDISNSGSGNLTDSALIGNASNQAYNTVLTNQSCTNNVGAAASYVLTQAAFAWHGLRGTEEAPINTPYVTAPESTNIVAVPGGKARLRISLTCTTADCPPLGFIPYYSHNSGSYTLLPDVYSADNVAFCGTSPDNDIPTSGTATTNQLSTAGAFVAGALIRTSNAIPTITMTTGKKTENEYCIAFSAAVAATDTFDFRIRRQDGTVLDAYTVTPRVTIQALSHGSGF